MTTQDFFINWGGSGPAPQPVWFGAGPLLNRIPILGVTPMLLPLAAVAVAVLEGTVAGAGFGLAVGILCDAVYFGTNGAMTLGICVAGMLAGALAQTLLRQNLLGCLLCSLLALAAIDGVRILTRLLLGKGELGAMLSLAGREILISMIFVFPVYAMFLWVYHRVPKKTVL